MKPATTMAQVMQDKITRQRVLAGAPQEIPLKQWLAEEAIRLGLSFRCVYSRYRRGKYPALKFNHINKRVVYVTPHPTTPANDL